MKTNIYILETWDENNKPIYTRLFTEFYGAMTHARIPKYSDIDFCAWEDLEEAAYWAASQVPNSANEYGEIHFNLYKESENDVILSV